VVFTWCCQIFRFISLKFRLIWWNVIYRCFFWVGKSSLLGGRDFHLFHIKISKFTSLLQSPRILSTSKRDGSKFAKNFISMLYSLHVFSTRCFKWIFDVIFIYLWINFRIFSKWLMTLLLYDMLNGLYENWRIWKIK
jgi:hypothetical protein